MAPRSIVQSSFAAVCLSVTSLGAACLTASSPAAAQYQPPEALHDGWAVGDARQMGWHTELWSQLASKIADGTYKNITSVLIAHHGQLIFEAYYNDGARERLNDMRSATKSVTSLLVGAAIDRGLIPSVQTKVYPYFPDKQPVEHPDPRKRSFTLEDLLTMSSLWECNDDNEFSSGNEERMYVTEDWLRFALGLPIKGFPSWQPKPADRPLGRAFSYCTAGVFTLGAVVERATHKRLDEFAAEALERPLGITQVHWNFSPQGIGVGGGGTRYRSRDIAKVGQLALEGGRWQGRQVISEKWISASLTEHARPNDDIGYGYLWWHFHFPLHGQDVGVWAASGNGGNKVFILPQEALVAVITSTAYNKSYAHPQSDEIYRELILKALP